MTDPWAIARALLEQLAAGRPVPPFAGGEFVEAVAVAISELQADLQSEARDG